MPGHAPCSGAIVSGQNLIFIAVGNTPDDDTLQQALLKKLLGKCPQFFWGIWVKSDIGGEKGTQLIYRKLTDRRSCHGKRVDKAFIGPVTDLHFRDLLGSAHALLQQVFHVVALSQATTPPAPDCGRTPRRDSSVRSPEYSYRRQDIPLP